jgi:hypothetical protein
MDDEDELRELNLPPLFETTLNMCLSDLAPHMTRHTGPLSHPQLHFVAVAVFKTVPLCCCVTLCRPTRFVRCWSR